MKGQHMGLKDKLGQIEQQAQERRQKREAEAGLHTEKLNVLILEFDQLKTSILIPALEEAREVLLSHNHGAIVRQEQRSISLDFCREKVIQPLQINSSPTMNRIVFSINEDKLLVEVSCPKAKQADGRQEPVEKHTEAKNFTRESVEGLIECAVRAVILSPPH
jgi:hypothetical protein